MSAAAPASQAPAVLRLGDTDPQALARLLAGYGLNLALVAADAAIPGSYWGDSEAGLRGDRLYARADTPVHSVLHEACHFICMAPERRAQLDRDAGGDDDEESAVCYLQILLAGELPAVGRARLIADMDAWGYSFRLGSTRAWFDGDAQPARQWLQRAAILDTDGMLSGRCRA